MPLTDQPPTDLRARTLPWRLATVVLGVLVLGGAAGFYALDTWTEELREEAGSHGKAIAAGLATALVEPLKNHKDQAAANLLKDWKKKAGLVYAEVVRPGDSKPLASTYAAGELPARKTRQNKSGNQATEDEVDGQAVMNVQAEVLDDGKLLGLVHVGLDLTKVNWASWLFVGLTVLEAALVLAFGLAIVRSYLSAEAATATDIMQLRLQLSEAQQRLTQEGAAKARLEAELKNAKESSASATQVKSTFLADLGQQLRAPMKQIIQTAELALGADPAPRLRDHLHHLRQSANALDTLVLDLLDFAQLDVGTLELEKVDFQLSDMLDKLLRGPSMRAKGKGLELETDIGDEVPEVVTGDPTRVRQILYHLVDNGIKYTNRGSVSVSVASVNQTATEATLRFSVEDTGIGIPVWKKDQLLDPSVLKEAKARGTAGGISLAMSAVLVELMGGKLELESQVGKGSRFYFTLKFPLPEKKAKVKEMPKFKSTIKPRVVMAKPKTNPPPPTAPLAAPPQTPVSSQ